MEDDGWMLAQRARIASLEAQVQGYIASNQFRLGLGQGIAYDDEAFQELADELNGIFYYMMENR